MKTSKSSIQDVLNGNLATFVVIKAEDLKQTIIDTINETRRRMEEEIALNNSDVLLTTNQVLDRLAISRTTLWSWTKRGYIIPIDIGGKQRYKLSDVNAILNGSYREIGRHN